MTVDLGTGDGHFVLARAAARPDEFVIGIDASHAAMAEASRRAGRASRRGGLANAHFLVAAVEALPCQLDGIADLVTVHFPWGTLMAGALGRDPAITSRIASLVAPHGRLRLLVSAAARDGSRGAIGLDGEDLGSAYERLGMIVTALEPATRADVDAARSSWGRRLTAAGSADRRVWRVELTRQQPMPGVRAV